MAATHTPGLRERKRLRTRRVVQRAALELFAAHGFRETTIAQIADAADVSMRTVTVHFPAKEDLVLSLGSEGFDALIEQIESRPEGQLTLEALRAWIVGQINESSAMPSSESLELLRLRDHVRARDQELQARLRSSDLRIERTLCAGIAHDLGLPADALAPRLAAAAVLTGLRTITETLFHGEESASTAADSPLALVDKTFDFARAGLGALAQPRPRPDR